MLWGYPAAEQRAEFQSQQVDCKRCKADQFVQRGYIRCVEAYLYLGQASADLGNFCV